MDSLYKGCGGSNGDSITLIRNCAAFSDYSFVHPYLLVKTTQNESLAEKLIRKSLKPYLNCRRRETNSQYNFQNEPVPCAINNPSSTNMFQVFFTFFIKITITQLVWSLKT